MAMDAYQQQLAAWQQAYPYLGASPTSAHQPTLGDYSDSRRKFMDMWAGAHPYSGLNPTSFGMSQAEMEAAGNATDESRRAFSDYEQWGSQGEQAWRAALTPEQRAQYDEMKSADYAKKQRMGQMAFLAAAGAMAAPGIMGALGSTASTSAEALAAADIAGGLIPEFGTEAAYLSGLGTYAMPVSAGSVAVSELPSLVGGAGEVASWYPEVASAAGGLGGLPGGGAIGPDAYYSGLGGVDGSIAGSGVNNPGFNTWVKGISPDMLSKLTNIFGGADSLIKGLYSLYQSNKFAELGKGTPAQQTANSQLDALLKDPSKIYTMPGWEAGLEAVQRTGAGQGYLGSGNMMIALNKYGGDFFNNTVKQLNDIATGGQAVQAAYNTGSANLFGQGTNSLGYWFSKYGSPIFDMIKGP